MASYDNTGDVEHLLDYKETARALGTSIHTLKSWVAKGRVPFIKMGRLVRFSPTDLREFVAASSHKPGSHITN